MRFVTIMLLAASLALGACSSKRETKASLDPFAGKGSPYYQGKGKIPVGGGKRHVGKPYQVAGRWFTPKDQPNYNKVGMSSWYGEAFHRRRTSNGEYFDMQQLTAAHATLPLPSYVRVTNLSNGKSVVVRVNDRGPFVGTRIIDVSKRTAEVLEYKRKGTERVRVQYLGPAPLNDPGARDLMAMNSGKVRQSESSSMVAMADDMPRKRKRRSIAAEQPVMQASYDQSISDDSGEPPIRALRPSYFVELGTFADPDNVERIKQGLADTGPMQVAEIEGADGPLYRLRLGPIADVNDANYVYNQAVSFGLPDARIVEAAIRQAALQ